MPIEIEGLSRSYTTTQFKPFHRAPSHLGNLYVQTHPGPHDSAPGVSLEGLGAVQRLQAKAYKDGRRSWIDVTGGGVPPMRITHTIGANLNKPPCACSMNGLGEIGCGCRFAGLGDMPSAKKKTALRVRVVFGGRGVSQAALVAEMQKLASRVGAQVLRVRRREEPHVLWSWQAIGGGRWGAFVANKGPFKGQRGAYVDMARTGQPPTVEQANRLPTCMSDAIFVLKGEQGAPQWTAALNAAMLRAVERSGGVRPAIATKVVKG